MAKTAVHEALNFNFPFGRAHAETMPKRKTPSELRGEQLKRRSLEMPADTKLASLLAPDSVTCSVKKPEPSRNPKYIDTKLNEHFPVRKSSAICRGIQGQEKSKVSLDFGTIADLGFFSHFPKPSAVCNLSKENKEPSDKNGKSEATENSSHCLKSSCNLGFQKIEKSSQSTFRSVAQLSIGKELSSDSTRIDMDKALKGLVARDSLGSSGDSSETSAAHPSMPTRKPQSEYQIFDQKTPLDFTLKHTIHLVSSSSVKWLHRLISSGMHNDVGVLNNPCNGTEQSSWLKVGLNTISNLSIRKALHSWKYPQSSLPSAIVSAMSLSASPAEADFLKKRQQDWEDSFHNLYYMLRQKKCTAFYVLTSQFVVLFISDLSASKRNCCNAYISQSTNGLRSLLAENDISFSMPLCWSKVEEATADDLVELSEIEKCNLGQAQHLDLSVDVDNSPQSLLAFLGNENVHALFDFLLNFRSFLSSLSSCDVPVLYSPVPFKNASIFSPEVRCKEMKRANFLSSGSDTDETESFSDAAATSVCYSIEIKDDILPPWVISGICAAMASRSAEFEASFILEPKSAGLNVALDSLHQNHELKNVVPSDCTNSFDIVETIAVPWLRSAYLRSLKHSKGSYTAGVGQL